MNKEIKDIVHIIIKDTCTHWLCANDDELNLVTTNLTVKINTLINQKANEFTEKQSNCNIPVVSNRRGLLIAYTKWLSTQKFEVYSTSMVDAFLGNL